jgi:hypothetical protein
MEAGREDVHTSQWSVNAGSPSRARRRFRIRIRHDKDKGTLRGRPLQAILHFLYFIFHVDGCSRLLSLFLTSLFPVLNLGDGERAMRDRPLLLLNKTSGPGIPRDSFPNRCSVPDMKGRASVSPTPWEALHY